MKTQTCSEIVSDASFHGAVLEHSTLVLVVFESDWSGACHILAPVIDSLATECAGEIKVCRLNVDTNPDTVGAYGIRQLPTLLLFNRGSLVDHLVGAVPKEALASLIARSRRCTH